MDTSTVGRDAALTAPCYGAAAAPTASGGCHRDDMTRSTEGGGRRTGLIKPLTGLRFVAALLVVLLHTFHIHVDPGDGPLPLAQKAMANLIARGFVGVTFFFILSGFILTYTYCGTRTGAAVDRRAFWIARMARIYPVYLFALAVAAVPMLYWSSPYSGCATNHPTLSKITTPLLLQAWVPCGQWTWNGPGWSLSVEAFFYLLFPFIVEPLTRARRPALHGIMGLALAAYLLIIALYCVINPGDENLLTMPRTALLNTFTLNPLTHLPEFVIGIALGRLFALRNAGPVRRRARPWLLHPGPLSIFATIAIVVLLAAAIAPTVQIVADFLLTPLFATLVYAVACNEGPVAGFLSLPPFLALGEASYALYLLHQPIWTWMSHLRSYLAPLMNQAGVTPGLYFLVFLCVAVTASLFTLRLIEQPARAAILRMLARRSSRAAGARGNA